MLEQSRDVSLVGGGEITMLPQGIDIEAMRTGGVSGMFFGIDRARYLTRQAIGGPRHRNTVGVVSPGIEGKLLYLQHRGRIVPVRAGGEIPSRAAAVGSGLNLLSGNWADSPSDSSYIVPTQQQLYDDLDRFHLPPVADSTWGEWHYFNVVTAPNEWWYLTYLIGGDIKGGNWGGQILATQRRPDGRYQRFTSSVRSDAIVFHTDRADLLLGESFVRQRDGTYRLHGTAAGPAGSVVLDLNLTPTPNRYFPPVELVADEFVSGYTVPALAGNASGRICVSHRCRRFEHAPAYHDHNWGVWRDVTWEWGTARGSRLSLLYGGVYGPERENASPFFLALVDSLGVKQVLRFSDIRYSGATRAAGTTSARAPARFSLTATRDADTLRLDVQVDDALGTGMGVGGLRRVFFQMRGRFTATGRVLGETVADSGAGFFETYAVPR
jgi:hypothetical protein